MSKKTVTLYVDDTSIRLTVTDGTRIQKWAECPLESGLVKGNVVVNEKEVANKIKQLFESQKLTMKKISVGVSGLHCLTRPITLPQLPKAILDEAVKREARRMLPVPLEQLYISWQNIPAPEGKIQVFLVAIPRETVDTLLKALSQAGFTPSFMDLKPLLLTRVVKEATAVIVDVQATEFDIVIMVDGIPQPVRTIPFLDEALPWQEKLAKIKNELDRTITFYNSNNPENSLDSSVPIYVSGELANKPESCQSVSDELGYPVLLLSSPLECPEGLDESHYMVNIGLSLQKLSSGKEARPSVINVNALPASYRPKPISLINILAPPGTVIAVSILAFLVILTQNYSADIESINVQLNKANQLLQQKQQLAGNIAELQKKINEIEASRGNFIAALGGLGKQSAGMNNDLEVTIKSLPSAVYLSSISHANGILTISGRAPTEKRVLEYLTGLDASGRFGEITITSMSRVEGEGMDFTLLGSLQGQNDRVSSIEAALNSLPTAISVTNVSTIDGTLNIDGKSPDESQILLYLQSLEASGKFDDITITSMTRIEGGGMSFSLVLKIGE